MKKDKHNSGLYNIIIITILLLLIIVSGNFFMKQQRKLMLEKENDSFVLKTSLGIPTSADPAFGNSNADVTIIYFYDYQCQWCREFDLGTFPRLKQDYIDTGKLRFIFKDFVFLGKDSRRLGLAAECIYKEYGTDKFLEYHSLTYQNQKRKNSGWGSKENILNYASKLGWLDTEYLQRCIENETYLQVVIDDTFSGRMAGVSSTPSFVIGDKKISGAQPYSVFKRIVESASIDIGDIKPAGRSTG